MNQPDDLPEDVRERLLEIGKRAKQLGEDMREGFCSVAEAVANVVAVAREMRHNPPRLTLRIPLYDCEVCGGLGTVECLACRGSENWKSCARCGGSRSVKCHACL
jgi:hypothetical protein